MMRKVQPRDGARKWQAKEWSREVAAKYGLDEAGTKDLQGMLPLAGAFLTPQCQPVQCPASCSQTHQPLVSLTSSLEGQLSADKNQRTTETQIQPGVCNDSVINVVKIRRSGDTTSNKKQMKENIPFHPL